MTIDFKTKKLDFVSINQLLGETFIIPDYQRGYRWQPKQVEQLLDDLWEFAYSNRFSLPEGKSPYCLQPIVVAQRDNGLWEVVDGQQRLTTINLLLKYLEEDVYTILYETRIASCSMDEYYRTEAEKVINSWFEKPIKIGESTYTTKQLKSKFINFLTDPELYLVHFIWYNVTDEIKANSTLVIDIFDRLNIGKIGLTNAELIKALFMTFVDKNTKSETHKQLIQIRLGTEWDEIEKTLQQPLFWSFICPDDKIYSTRIEYLFDILANKGKDEEDKYTFNIYSHRIKSEAVESLWLEVKQLFLQMSDWYQHPECFHYVGYLTACGYTFRKILSFRFTNNVVLPKDEVTQKLLIECKKTVEYYELDDGNFYTNYNPVDIRKILLLFNILTITTSQNKSQHFMRFPFDEYRRKDDKGKCIWDIEHIHSQTDKNISSSADKIEWIKTMLLYYTGVSDENEYLSSIKKIKNKEEQVICQSLYDLLQKITNQEKVDEKFNMLYQKLRRQCENDESFENVHSLGNLTLLDKWTNRSYQNAFFPVKRMIIIDNAKDGRYIPLCTQNVFMKAYSKHLGTLTEWKNEDCQNYLEEIKRIIQNN
jgi:hypothetical protein